MKKYTLITIVLIATIVSVSAGIAQDPSAIDVAARFRAPTATHLLGTDELGRDVTSRAAHGGVRVLAMAVAAVTISASISIFIASASITSSWYSKTISFVSDTMLLVPDALTVIFAMSMLGTGAFPLVVSLSLVFFPRYVRIVQGNVMRFRSEGYMLSLRARGVGEGRIILVHLVPLVLRQMSVQSAYNLGGAIFVTSTLGFLGVGLGTSAIEWGSMIRWSMPYAFVHPWPIMAYGGAALLASYACNLAGEKLKDSLRRYEYIA